MSTGNTHTYSDAEWQARVDLAAAYRLTDHFGMTDTHLQSHHYPRPRHGGPIPYQ